MTLNNGLPRVEHSRGYAATWHEARPHPPSVLVDILTQLAGTRLPGLVVDLACGTGHSTQLWAGCARQVVGIEPSADLCRKAAQTGPVMGNVSFSNRACSDTGLPGGAADIVTCSQSFHWLEPHATLAEVARLLRRGGVFAAYDCDWPPTMSADAEMAYNRFMERARELEQRMAFPPSARRWPKNEHLEHLRDSGHFRYVREFLVHSQENGDAERLVGLATSQGTVVSLSEHGVAAETLGLDTLRAEAEAALGTESVPWTFSYRVRIGIR